MSEELRQQKHVTNYYRCCRYYNTNACNDSDGIRDLRAEITVDLRAANGGRCMAILNEIIVIV